MAKQLRAGKASETETTFSVLEWSERVDGEASKYLGD